jgi:hypothetical protein
MGRTEMRVNGGKRHEGPPDLQPAQVTAHAYRERERGVHTFAYA